MSQKDENAQMRISPFDGTVKPVLSGPVLNCHPQLSGQL